MFAIFWVLPSSSEAVQIPCFLPVNLLSPLKGAMAVFLGGQGLTFSNEGHFY